MSALLFQLLLMAIYTPYAWAQSTSTLSASRAATLAPVESVVASVAASRSSAIASSTTAAAARPSLLFANIDKLTSCGSTQVYWYIFGLSADLYDISLFAIKADVATSSAITSATPSSARTTVAASSVVPTSSPSLIPTTSVASRILSSSSSAALRSTALVGRELYIRQSQVSGNSTIATAHGANEPFTFNITLPAGQYYLSGTLNDSLRTTARSNVFQVVEGSDTACLVAAVKSTSTSIGTKSSITGGVMQTPGSSTETSTTSSVSGGAIAGIVVGVIGGLAILAFLAFCCLRRRRRQRNGAVGNRDRFSTLPSASSQDGAEHGTGAMAAVGGWRRDSDEKGIDSAEDHDTHPAVLGRNKDLPVPYPAAATLAPEESPSLGDRRRQAGPPTTHTLTEKTSMQGFIGKSPSSNESSAVPSRSSSFGGAGAGTGAVVAATKDTGVGRSTSAKRKPVPSLGPELRSQLERERKMSEGGGGKRVPSVPDPNWRKSYSLVPDQPLKQ